MKTSKNDFLIYKNASGELERSPVIVENMEIGKGKTGIVSLWEANTGNELGFVTYSLTENNNKKSLQFEGLTSHVEGKSVGTKLVLELINLSKRYGAEGVLTAQASFSSESKILRPKTNIPFYYKLGFRATDPKKDAEIQKCGDNIPLRLNVFTAIELSKEAATALEQKEAAKRQAFANQNAPKTLTPAQMKLAKKELHQ